MAQVPDSDWIAQTRRGVIELCLLTLVRTRPRYGYELVATLARWPALEVAEGTIYPLLRRLERGGVLRADWKESVSGPPRKYYSLTEAGRQQLERKLTQWESIAQSVDDLKRSETAMDAQSAEAASLRDRKLRPLALDPKTTGGGSR